MSWRSIRTNQFSSRAFCVENEFCVENYFIIYDHLRNHITFEHPNNPPRVHFVWKMILNQRSAEEPCYIWAPNQFTIPLSLHRSHSHLDFHSFPCCLLLKNSVPASCVVKIFQSIDGWRCTLFLNIKPIHKHQINAQYLSLSIFRDVFSARIRFLQVVW